MIFVQILHVRGMLVKVLTSDLGVTHLRNDT